MVAVFVELDRAVVRVPRRVLGADVLALGKDLDRAVDRLRSVGSTQPCHGVIDTPGFFPWIPLIQECVLHILHDVGHVTCRHQMFFFSKS